MKIDTSTELAAAESIAYHTRPGELKFGDEGWTWKQESAANLNLLRAAEHDLDAMRTRAEQAESALAAATTALEERCQHVTKLSGELMAANARVAKLEGDAPVRREG